MNWSETGRVHVTAFEEVPQIDLGPMFGEDRQARCRVGDAVRHACIDVGFFYIRNHGVPQATVDETFRQMARFFALPEHAKRRIHASNSRYFRGYSGLYQEQHDATTDYCAPHEVIDFGRENAPGEPPECEASPLYGPNLWPADMPGFREAVEAYYAAMLEASNALLRAFALAPWLSPRAIPWTSSTAPQASSGFCTIRPGHPTRHGSASAPIPTTRCPRSWRRTPILASRS